MLQFVCCYEQNACTQQLISLTIFIKPPQFMLHLGLQQYYMYPLRTIDALSQLSAQQQIHDDVQSGLGFSELWLYWNLHNPAQNHQQIHSHTSQHHSHQEQEHQEDPEQPPPSPKSEQPPPINKQIYKTKAKIEIPKRSIVKKIGQIILPHMKNYGEMNMSVIKMIKKLRHGQTFTGNKQYKVFRNLHFKLLFGGRSPQTSSRNLAVTRKILCSYLRKSIINSKRLHYETQIEYLNRIKCFALRCCNARLTQSKNV